jgi:predicted esterase
MTCRRIAASVLVPVLVFGAGMAAARSPSPQLGAVTQPANVSAPAARLAFANQRYRAQIFPGATSTTATYRTANDLITGLPTALKLDLYRPAGDIATSRPLLVWVHGGGFASGNRSSMASESIAYARLGYVTATISYRLDAGNKCLLVQAGAFTGAALVTERARCERAILAARDDAAAAIAWLRANAAAYGIDATRVAIGGSSAGAVTAIHVGQSLNTPGNPPPAASHVSAVLAMSGCNYLEGSIDALDAPVAIAASGGDALVPFACSAATLDAASAVGTPVVRSYFPLESAHAEGLYLAHQAEIDRAWRAFLVEHLELP